MRVYSFLFCFFLGVPIIVCGQDIITWGHKPFPTVEKVPIKDTTYRSISPIWFTPCAVEEINGLALGAFGENVKNGYDLRDSLTINGLNFEILFLLGFMDRDSPDSLQSFLKYFKNRSKLVIKGVNLSLINSSHPKKVEGVSIVGLGSELTVLNGVTIAGATNSVYLMNGVSIGGYNFANIGNGLQLGIYNQSVDYRGVELGLYNQSKDFRGVQIGIVNQCDHCRGIQIGLININGGRVLPFFNWRF